MTASRRRRIRSKQYREKRRAKIRRRAGLVVGSFVLLAGLLAGGTHLNIISISEITVDGNMVTSTAEIRQIAERQLAGSYAFLFSKQNSAIYPKKSIASHINEKYARIEDVSVELRDLTTLSIEVTEREPYALWCKGDMQGMLQHQECYFLDKEGFVYSQAPQFSGHVFFRFYGDITADDPVGEWYLTDELFDRIRSFLTALEEELDLRPVAYTIEDDNDGHVKVVTDTPEGLSGSILFSPSSDLNAMFENLQTLLSRDTFQGELKKEGYALDYIDLRYGNKVYYRLDGVEKSTKEKIDGD